jgi:hypothetical protein
MTSPYESLPDHRFWRRGVARVEPFLLDPVVEAGFKIAPADKVATAGSCFAQQIARSLRDGGLNYHVAERPDDGMSEAEARRRNFGVFSARTGNIYTARQLVQLFHEAFGRRRPAETAWRRGDGRFVDAFRPRIEPDCARRRAGAAPFASRRRAADVRDARRLHLHPRPDGGPALAHRRLGLSAGARRHVLFRDNQTLASSLIVALQRALLRPVAARVRQFLSR